MFSHTSFSVFVFLPFIIIIIITIIIVELLAQLRTVTQEGDDSKAPVCCILASVDLWYCTSQLVLSCDLQSMGSDNKVVPTKAYVNSRHAGIRRREKSSLDSAHPMTVCLCLHINNQSIKPLSVTFVEVCCLLCECCRDTSGCI